MVAGGHVGDRGGRNCPFVRCPSAVGHSNVRVPHGMLVRVFPCLPGTILIDDSVGIDQRSGGVVATGIEEVAVVAVTADVRIVLIGEFRIERVGKGGFAVGHHIGATRRDGARQQDVAPCAAVRLPAQVPSRGAEVDGVAAGIIEFNKPGIGHVAGIRHLGDEQSAGAALEVLFQADVDEVVRRPVGSRPVGGEAVAVGARGVQSGRGIRLAGQGGGLGDHAGGVVVVVDRVELVVVGRVCGQPDIGEVRAGAIVNDCAIAEGVIHRVLSALRRLGPGGPGRLAHDHDVVAVPVLCPLQINGACRVGRTGGGGLGAGIYDRLDGDIAGCGQRQVVRRIRPIDGGVVDARLKRGKAARVVPVAHGGELPRACRRGPIAVVDVVGHIGGIRPSPVGAVGGLAQAVFDVPARGVGVDGELELVGQHVAEGVGLPRRAPVVQQRIVVGDLFLQRGHVGHGGVGAHAALLAFAAHAEVVGRLRIQVLDLEARHVADREVLVAGHVGGRGAARERVAFQILFDVLVVLVPFRAQGREAAFGIAGHATGHRRFPHQGLVYRRERSVGPSRSRVLADAAEDIHE